MARVALSIVGGAVGSYFGQPQLGYLLGSLAGGALFPEDLGTVSGPRLNSGGLGVNSNAFGSIIPTAYGTIKISGQVIWADDIKESSTSTTQGGKGGPTQTQVTYTYSCSFAVALCEGERKLVDIYLDNILVYSNYFETAPDLATATAQTQFAPYFTFYSGSETQLPDSVIEGIEGTGNVPAFRGLSYLVFEDLPLEEYGNRIPSVSVTTTSLSAESFTSVTDQTIDRYAAEYRTQCSYIPDDRLFKMSEYHFNDGSYFRWITRYPNGSIVTTPFAYAVTRGGASSSELSVNADRLIHCFKDRNATHGYPLRAVEPDGTEYEWWTAGEPINASGIAIRGQEAVAYTQNGNTVYWSNSGLNILPSAKISSSRVLTSFEITADYIYAALTSGTSIFLYRYNKSLEDEVLVGKISAIGATPNVIAVINVISDTLQYVWHGFTLYKLENGIGSTISSPGSSPSSSNNNNNAGAAFKTTSDEGLTIFVGPNSPVSKEHIVFMYKNNTPSANETVGDIASSVCQNAGLSSNDIDVSPLTDAVRGYLLNQGSGAGALFPLTQAYQFDPVESDFKLKFIKRAQ